MESVFKFPERVTVIDPMLGVRSELIKTEKGYSVKEVMIDEIQACLYSGAGYSYCPFIKWSKVKAALLKSGCQVVEYDKA